MRNPLITIITTVGPERRYLDAAMSSVQAQTSDDFGLMIYFDGAASPVNARNLVLRTANDDAPGRLRSLQSTARMVTSEWMTWLDADDTLHPAAIAKLVSVIRRFPTAKTIFTGWTHRGVPMTPLVADDPSLFRAAHLTCVKRETLDSIGGFDACPEVGMFFDLRLRLQEAGEVVTVNDPLYNFRSHPGQISRTRRDEQLEQMKRAAERAKERRHA